MKVLNRSRLIAKATLVAVAAVLVMTAAAPANHGLSRVEGLFGGASETGTPEPSLGVPLAPRLDRQRTHVPKLGYVPGEVIVKLKDEPAGPPATPLGQGLEAALLGLQVQYRLESPSPVFQRLHTVLESQRRLQGRVRGAAPSSVSAGPAASLGPSQVGLLRVYLLRTDRDVRAVCAELLADPAVEYAQPNYIYEPCARPNDPYFPDQYAHQLTQIEPAWDITTGSPDVVVAPIGTGVDIEHPDLQNNIWINEDEIPGNGRDDDGNGLVDDRHGWNFEDNDNDVRPGGFSWYQGHETSVAGVIAAAGNNGRGVCGVSWSCKIMALRVGFSTAEIAAALEYATANGARVVNMSFGHPDFGPEGDPIVKEALDAAFAKGVLLVAAAGNDNEDWLTYPGAWPNVLAVAATAGDDKRSLWGSSGGSSFGPWVDLAAPGTDILTTDFQNEEESYGIFNGTSLAAPYVAGLGALLFSLRPELTNVDVRAILENTTDPVDYGVLAPDVAYAGTGRVNAYRALQGANVAYPLGEIAAPVFKANFAEDVNAVPLVLFAHGDSYRLEHRIYGEDAWTLVHEGNPAAEAQADGLIHLTLANPGVGTYTLRLTVTSGGVVHTDDKVFGVPPGGEQEHWPTSLPEDDAFSDLYGTLEMYDSSPICLDIDVDGRNEVIQAASLLSWFTYGGLTHIWDEDANSPAGWPGELDDAPSTSSCAAGDVDGDGDFEVITTTWYGGIYVWHSQDGEPVSGWPKWLAGYIDYPVALADLDSDGDSEMLVVLLGSDDAGIQALQGDGTPLWQRRYDVLGPLSVADLDRDGDVEIVVCGYGLATSTARTYILDHEGYPVKQWAGGSGKGTAVADLDADGQMEIVFCTEDSIQAVHVDGTTLWNTQVQEDFEGPGAVSVGDLDNDGLSEVYATGAVELEGLDFVQVFAWDHAGRLLTEAGFPKTIRGYRTSTAPLIGNVDDDVEKELLVGLPGRALMAWNRDGTVPRGFPMYALEPEVYTTPALADLDQDGDVEVLVGGYDYKFHVIDLPGSYAPGTIDWGTLRHDPQCSGWALQSPKLNPVSVPAQIKPGGRVQIELSSSNPDNLPVRYYVGHLPAGARFDSATNTVLWKPAADQVFESHTFYAVVTDGVRQDLQAVSVTVVPDAIYHTNMDTDPGWHLDEGWAWGTPSGEGSENGDPNCGRTGQNVIGYELAGDYANSMPQTRYAAAGPIDCRGYKNIRLSFCAGSGSKPLMTMPTCRYRTTAAIGSICGPQAIRTFRTMPGSSWNMPSRRPSAMTSRRSISAGESARRTIQ